MHAQHMAHHMMLFSSTIFKGASTPWWCRSKPFSVFARKALQILEASYVCNYFLSTMAGRCRKEGGWLLLGNPFPSVSILGIGILARVALAHRYLQMRISYDLCLQMCIWHEQVQSSCSAFLTSAAGSGYGLCTKMSGKEDCHSRRLEREVNCIFST